MKDEGPLGRRNVRQVAAKNCVTIFGGGIAGLTAAHELVERGFRVQVWEPKVDVRRGSRGPELGGMARTQWAAVPWPLEHQASAVTPLAEAFAARGTKRIRDIPQRFFLDASGTEVRDALGRYGCSGGEDMAIEVAEEMVRELIEDPTITEIYCEVLEREVRKKRKTRTREQRKALGAAVIGALNRLVSASKLRGAAHIRPAEMAKGPAQHAVDAGDLYLEALRTTVDFGHAQKPARAPLEVVIVGLDEFPDELPTHADIVLSFRVRQRWIPGEHGFRFFPAFYHHLFDTMKRIPLLEPVEKLALGASQERSMSVNANRDRYTESGRSVFDNLLSTSKLAVGFGDGLWPAELSRSLPTSLEELYSYARILFEGAFGSPELGRGLGLSPRDVARLQLKVLQFLTSGPKRRRDYEQLSWLEFLGGKRAFSPNFVRAVSAWPEALIAMRADEVDARTHGAVLAQLYLDNLKRTEYRDGTLNGPTSEALFKPWKRYLEAQGVEFIHGKLMGFREVESPAGDIVIWPEVECYEPRYPDAGDEPPLLPGYFVLALPAREARRVARTYVRQLSRSGIAVDRHPDLHRLARQRQFGTLEHEEDSDEHASDLDRPKPAGQLRHMVGVQYYFDEDISWLDGHAYFAGSPWGLSSISQVRFWQEKHDWEHGYRGVLSVVISIFDQRSPVLGKTCWECSPEELAEEVWRQVQDSLGGPDRVPQPRYWHLDDDFEYDSQQRRFRNGSPYQINLPQFWATRPGELSHGENLARAERSKSRAWSRAQYAAVDGIVCAGTHMKTFTRLTTMEAANESARHAVNAILADSGVASRRSACAIYPIEEREVEDFQLLKEVDDELYDRDLPHFVEILGLDELVTQGLRGGASDPLSLRRVRDLLSTVRSGIKFARDQNSEEP